MSIVQQQISTSLVLDEGQSLECVDIFCGKKKKRIELASHSTLTYLILAESADIDVEIVTRWSWCSCTVFALFVSDVNRQVKGSIKVFLKDSHTSAHVDLISFLYDSAKIDVDGIVDVATHVDNVHGRLLQQNIVLWKDISLKTLPQLNVSSCDVHASHGAKMDSLDPQKLLYMMSRGLTKEQSQTLLVDGYVDSVLAHFSQLDASDRDVIVSFLGVRGIRVCH